MLDRQIDMRAEVTGKVATGTLIERIHTLEKLHEVQARHQLELEDWLGKLYQAVGVIYPGDQPRER